MQNTIGLHVSDGAMFAIGFALSIYLNAIGAESRINMAKKPKGIDIRSGNIVYEDDNTDRVVVKGTGSIKEKRFKRLLWNRRHPRLNRIRMILERIL